MTDNNTPVENVEATQAEVPAVESTVEADTVQEVKKTILPESVEGEVTSVKEETVVEPAAEVAKEEVSAPELDWKSVLSEELKESSFLKKFEGKTLEDVLKSAANAHSLVGKKVSDFTAEDLQAFREKVGIPTKKEDYKLPTELGEKLDVLTEKYLEAGLTQEQAKSLTDTLIEQERAAVKAEETALATKLSEAKERLEKEFGTAYEKRIDMATKAIKEYGGQALLDSINESGLGLNPDLIIAFSKIGKGMAEDTIVSSDMDTTFGITPEESKQRFAAIMSDPKKMAAWKNPTHPNHKAVIAEIRKYTRYGQ